MHRKILLALLLSLLPLACFFLVPSARASTTINVNSTSDVIANDGKCTLREAIIAANTDTASGAAANECPAGSGVDTIVLPAGTYTITIAGLNEDSSLTGDFDVKQSVTIRGAGYTCGSPNPKCTLLHGNLADRVLDITTTIQVTVSDLQIYRGDPLFADGGGIRNYGRLKLDRVIFAENNGTGAGLKNKTGAYAALDTAAFVSNHSDSNGGAIWNEGTLFLSGVIMAFDTAELNGGGLFNEGYATLTDVSIGYETATGFDGGGILNNSLITITQSTLQNNTSLNGNGGGLFNWNTANITNTTFTANSTVTTTGKGGAVYGAFGGYGTTLTHVTMKNNTASTGGAIYRAAGAQISLKNTIVADSVSGGNCSGEIVSLGYNLDSANTCAFSATGDITSTAPMLGSLVNNGGKTSTHALLVGSPAINKIPFGTNGCGTTITTDERGYARVSPCDIGAFEYVLRVLLPLINR